MGSFIRAQHRRVVGIASLIVSFGLSACSSSSSDSSGGAVDSRSPLLAADTGWTRIASVPYTGQLTSGVGYEFDDLTVDQGNVSLVFAEQFIQIERPTPITTAYKKATFPAAGHSAPTISTIHYDTKNPDILHSGAVHAHFVSGVAQLTTMAPLANRAASQLSELDETGNTLATVAAPDIVNVNTIYAPNHAIAMGAAYVNGAGQGYAGLFAFDPAQGWPEVPATLENYDPGFKAPLPDTLDVDTGGLLPFFASDLTPRAAVLINDGRFVVLKPDFAARGFQTELSFALPQYAYHYEDLRNTVYARIIGYGKSGNTHSFLVSERVYDSDALTPVTLYRWTEGATSLEKVYSVPESLSTHGSVAAQKSTGKTHLFDISADGSATLAISNTANEARVISKDGDAVLSKTGAFKLAVGAAPAYVSRVYELDGVRYLVAYTFTHPNTVAEDLQLEVYRYDP